MQLTKGQKDALVRKVMAIINNKMEAKREELRKKYQPSKEAAEFLEKVKKLLEARKKFYKTIDELGFRINYNCIESMTGADIHFELNFSKKDAKLSDYSDKIMDVELGKLYNSKFKYPSEQDVVDDIELNNLSKSFDIDTFLEKYNNL